MAEPKFGFKKTISQRTDDTFKTFADFKSAEDKRIEGMSNMYKDGRGLVNSPLVAGIDKYYDNENKFNRFPDVTYPMFIDIKDNRSVRATTGKPINSNTDSKTGRYESSKIYHIAKTAINSGYDPYVALGVSMAESALGNKDNNLGHVQYDAPDTPSRKDFYYDRYNMSIEDNMQFDDMEEYEALRLINALKYQEQLARAKGYTDSLYLIQAYNGLGKISGNTEKDYHKRRYGINNVKQFYGVPIPHKGSIDLSRNPLYGKEVLDLAKMLKGNSDIRTMIDTISKGNNIPYER